MTAGRREQWGGKAEFFARDVQGGRKKFASQLKFDPPIARFDAIIGRLLKWSERFRTGC